MNKVYYYEVEEGNPWSGPEYHKATNLHLTKEGAQKELVEMLKDRGFDVTEVGDRIVAKWHLYEKLDFEGKEFTMDNGRTYYYFVKEEEILD